MKWLTLILLPLSLIATEPFFTLIDPPSHWLISDPSKYEKGIKVTFIASKKKMFTPSLTLSTEKVGNATVEDYTHALEKIYHGKTFQKLGTFETAVGTGHLFQIDQKSQWGDIRLLQAFVLHDGYALIQTGACLRKEFLNVHEDYLKTFKSLRVTPSLVESCHDAKLQKKIEALTKCWHKLCGSSKEAPETLFASSFFQTNQWKPLVNYVEKALASEGKCWQFLALKHIQETLLMENES
ncbi:MAG: hypothetical protein KDK64_02460 [Chlamydiia bacterium]|nr:hypothetical protein [Chlamydiia bacterium]